ncbi:ester cyclase [Haloarchaeobius sp. HRN-SO-5]|uniref:ester cyclase n=1 Tax=Haloarchaeobius sp. HRN-SO-5 TaxID=3446118 RepID=UPI003EBEC1DA
MAATDREGSRVAIACQGGGSHTAFTAGVLDRLLSEDDVEFDVVGLSGTSGGAICAFATWFGLASDEGRNAARRLLRRIWGDISAKATVDSLVNTVGVGMVRAESMGVPLPTFSPYDTPVSDWSRDVLRETLEDAIDPADLDAVVGRDDPLPPRLDIGAVDVQRGTFRTFTERDVTYDAVLASAAVPNLFKAAPVTQPDGTTRYYWDGLFSQNPPLGELFMESEERLERADELWIVQINPQREDDIPTRLEAIADRRNELGGNLSVNQELGFIRQLNQWRAEGELTAAWDPIEVKTINLDESLASPGRSFDYATKLDRSPRFLQRLWTHGREQAERFLATERDRRVAREAVETAWTPERDAVFDEMALPSFEANLPASLVELRGYLRGDPEQTSTVFGAEEYVEFTSTLREAVPDLRFGVEELVVEPDHVAVRWRGTGTHTGSFLDIEPTGEDVELSGITILHLEDGRVSKIWSLFEQWSLLRQLADAEPAPPVSTTSRVAATPVVTQLSAPAENEDLARTEVEAVWNDGRREALDRVLADDCVLHLDTGNDLRGRDAYWAFVERYRDAFPDLEVTIEDTVSEGDKIVLRMQLRGTHRGRFLGVDPTGERIDVARMAIHHVDDGRIVETGMVEDTVRLLHQLGARPATLGLKALTIRP